MVNRKNACIGTFKIPTNAMTVLPIIINRRSENMANTVDYVNLEERKAMTGQMEMHSKGSGEDNLTQEEKDLRLAMSLQQQENASAYDASKKRHDQTLAAKKARTGRSSVGTSLPHIRKVQKANENVQGAGVGMYDAPVTDPDVALAMQLQREDMVSAGTAEMVERMVKTNAAGNASSVARNARSGTRAFKK